MLNLTAQVRDGTGREVCVSATWNAPRPLDEASLVERYVTVFRSLDKRSG